MADTQARIVISAVDATAAGIAKAKAGLAGLQQTAATAGAALAGLAGPLAALGSLSVLGSGFKSIVNGLDALNDAADATGASIENLSALEDIAARTGTSFDTVTGSLLKFNQALNAAKPGAESFEVFKRIGLDVAELRRLDPAEALLKTADALGQFAADGERARAEQLIFGRSLREIAPLLRDVAEAGGLNAKVTAEQALQAEKFNQNLAALAKNATDAGRAIAAGLLPKLNEVFVRFAVLQQTYGSLGAGLAANFGERTFLDAAQGVEFFSQKLRDLDKTRTETLASNQRRGLGILGEKDYQEERARIQKLVDFYSGVRKSIGGGRPANEGGGRIASAGQSIGTIAAVTKTAEKAAGSFTDYAQQIAQQVARMIDDTDIVKFADLNAQLAELDKLAAAGLDPKIIAQVREKLSPAKLFSADEDFPAVPAALLERSKALRELLDSTPSAQLERQRALLQDLAQAYERGQFGLVGSAEAMARFGEASQTALGGVPEKLDQISTFAEQAGRNIQDALGDSITQALDGDFKSIGDLWANLLKRMLAQALAAKLNEALFGAAGVGSGAGALGGFFSGLFGISGKRAAGGPVSAGRAYLVGERGPEIFAPASNGTIIPNGGGQSVVINQTLNIGAGVGRAEVFAAMNAAKRAAVAEVEQQLRRGRMATA